MRKYIQKTIFENTYNTEVFESSSNKEENLSIIQILNELLQKNDIIEIKEILKIIFNNSSKEVDGNLIVNQDDIEKAINSYSLERTKYYIKKIIKSITEIKTSNYNDINLNRWKDYNDIITDSLWILERRDNSGAHNGQYWGNFVPQIPNQLMKRYTKKGDWILDPFLGSGTTLIEARKLGRNALGIELKEEVAKMAQDSINSEKNLYNVKTIVKIGDSSKLDFNKIIAEENIEKVQFVILHPPYWDIIKFSDDPNDLSNSKTLNDFLYKIGEITDNSLSILESKRFFALVISDKYYEGEWIPLAFLTMQEILRRKCVLKSIIIKNFEETKGKLNQKELWRYRALVGGFYIFKHEYIFLFQKK